MDSGEAPKSLLPPCFKGSCLHCEAQRAGLGIQHGCGVIVCTYWWVPWPESEAEALKECVGVQGASGLSGDCAGSAHQRALFLPSIDTRSHTGCWRTAALART